MIKSGDSHNCYFPSGWNAPYSHATVAIILTNANKEIALVARRPGEPAEGGKLALPGGYVERHQTLAQAAATEALEETGYALVPRTLARFAILDGPTSLPGRKNEHNGNVVTVFSAQASRKVRDHDSEVTRVSWVSRHNLPTQDAIAFGHYAILGMWFKHKDRPFRSLPIFPSEMSTRELLPQGWPRS